MKKIISITMSAFIAFNMIFAVQAKAAAPKKAITVAASDVTTSRISGHDRLDTAVQISQSGWTKSDYVILATGSDYPDALCATPLAASKNAPILLTMPNSLSDVAKNEIIRLQATHVIIIGGTVAVSANVESTLKGMGLTVDRISGSSRYDTSARIAANLGNFTKIAVVTGVNFPDALSIAPICAKDNMPILLTQAASLPTNISSFLKDKSITDAYIVGGTGAIGNTVCDTLAGKGMNVTRIDGSNRFATNANVLSKFDSELNFDNTFVATGMSFPDALAGSVLAAKNNTGIILVGDNIDINTINFIKTKTIYKLTALGGSVSVKENILTSLTEFPANVPEYYYSNYTLDDTALVGQNFSLPGVVTITSNKFTPAQVNVSWTDSYVDTTMVGTYSCTGVAVLDNQDIDISYTVDVSDDLNLFYSFVASSTKNLLVSLNNVIKPDSAEYRSLSYDPSTGAYMLEYDASSKDSLSPYSGVLLAFDSSGQFIGFYIENVNFNPKYTSANLNTIASDIDSLYHARYNTSGVGSAILKSFSAMSSYKSKNLQTIKNLISKGTDPDLCHSSFSGNNYEIDYDEYIDGGYLFGDILDYNMYSLLTSQG